MNAFLTTGRRLSPFALLLVLLCTGCKGGQKAPPDPMLGRPAPAGKAIGARGSLPDIPAAPSTTSTAALAPGDTRGMSSDLRIGDPSARPTGSATLGRPEPLREGMTTALPGPASPPASPSPAIALTGGPGKPQTVEQALTYLEGKGVKGAKLEYLAESREWRFACSLPHRNNPQMRRTHQTQAREPLAAVQAVLEQIEREQR